MEKHKRVKISSQLQVRIPTELYTRYGFGAEAYVVPTETGIELRPAADPVDQGAIILQELLDEGMSGEALVQEFRRRAKESKEEDPVFYQATEVDE